MEAEWKVNKLEWTQKIIAVIAKFLVLPWALKTAIFDSNFPIEVPNLFWALIVVYFVWKLVYVLANPPKYQMITDR